MNERPILERFGLAYFKRRAAALPPVEAMDEVHVLNPTELAALRAVERGAILRAATVGFLSGLASALAEYLATPMLGPDPSAAPMDALIAHYAIVLGVTAVATALEIGFLYWDALRSVHELARVAGLSLFAEGDDDEAGVATALARAALELPNPPRGIFDIDARRESNRLVLLSAALVYKLKIGVTSFLVKAILRRLLGRAALRTWLVFVAAPITAAWNAWVAWLVLREARIRVMGPSAAKWLADTVLGGVELSAAAKLAVLRAVGSSIVRTHDLHPNLVAFLLEVHRHVGTKGDEPLDDSHRFLAELAKLPREEQDVVLRVLSIGAILDGKLARDEKRLVREALAAAGRTPTTEPVEKLRRTFVRGQPIDLAIVRATASG